MNGTETNFFKKKKKQKRKNEKDEIKKKKNINYVLALVLMTGIKADSLRAGGSRTGVPPDLDTSEGVGNLLIVVDGDEGAVAVPSELSLELAGTGGAGGAEVGLGGCVELVTLHVLTTVLVDGDVAIRVDEGDELVEDEGDVFPDGEGDVILRHGNNEEQACYGWPHPCPDLCTH